MTRALVFPGQGAQAVGMGMALAEAYPAARAVFEEVDDALGEPLSRLIREGDAETLTLTSNAQPALMATSMAALAALEAEGLGMAHVDFVAGHSLGEYSAYCAAGAISLADTARLLRIRGTAMQDAVPVGVGAMAAILGLGYDAVAEIAADAAGDEVCQAGERQRSLAGRGLGSPGGGGTGGGARARGGRQACADAAGLGPVPLRADGARGPR